VPGEAAAVAEVGCRGFGEADAPWPRINSFVRKRWTIVGADSRARDSDGKWKG
jgi:hypothetical protein